MAPAPSCFFHNAAGRVATIGIVGGLLLVPPAYAGKKDPPPPFEQMRFSFEPENTDSLTQTQDQVTISLSVIDMTNYKEHPKTWASVEYLHKNSRMMQSMDWMACQAPMFKAVVENGSDQTLKLRSRASGSSDEVIVALDDGEGETLYAARKENLFEGKEGNYRMGAELNGADPDQMAKDLQRADEALQRGLPFLTDEATVLPGRKNTFYICFNYGPWGSDNAVYEAWMRGRDAVTLGLYDVPVKRNDAGGVERKTKYEFKLNVAEWKYVYRYVWDEKAKTWWIQKPEVTQLR